MYCTLKQIDLLSLSFLVRRLRPYFRVTRVILPKTCSAHWANRPGPNPASRWAEHVLGRINRDPFPLYKVLKCRLFCY